VFVLSLSVNGSQLRLCVDTTCPAPLSVSGLALGSDGWLQAAAVVPAPASLSLGSRTSPTAAVSITQLRLAANTAFIGAESLAEFAASAAGYQPMSQNRVSVTIECSASSDTAFVGAPIAFVARGSTLSGMLRMRITFYGVPMRCDPCERIMLCMA
jgi:hypothetical protein